MIALPHFRPAFAGSGLDVDADALAYIAAVEAADGQSLESATRLAINSFVKGCKTDGIWGAIKASCILAGARTLSGALVPLRGTAPTNFNFVSGDYNRKTGLVGNGTTKYLDSNRNNNADPQDSKSISNWATVAGTLNNVSIGAGANNAGATTVGSISGSTRNNCATIASGGLTGYTGLCGSTRSESSGYTRRVDSNNFAVTQASQTPINRNIFVFGTNGGAGVLAPTDNRISFYHIGEHLDLSALDSRVSALMTSINSAIP